MERSEVEVQHGKVWSTEELREEFDVEWFCAPFIFVRRKSDGVKGSMTFQHLPRLYFGFVEDKL